MKHSEAEVGRRSLAAPPPARLGRALGAVLVPALVLVGLVGVAPQLASPAAAVTLDPAAGSGPAPASSCPEQPGPLQEFTSVLGLTFVTPGWGPARVGVPAHISFEGAWIPAPDTVRFEWLLDEKPIAGENGPSYTPVAADAGHRLKFRMTACKTGYAPVLRETYDVHVRLEPYHMQSSTPAPQVYGDPRPGQLLTVWQGSWIPTPEQVSVAWRNADAPAGSVLETGPSYRVTSSDAGKRLVIELTLSRHNYPSMVYRLDPITVSTLRLIATPKPRIRVAGGGTAKAGKKLIARTGTWKPAKVTVKYRWLRNGKAIRGATKSKYKLTRKDRGKRISVRVTGSKVGYATVSKISSAKRISRVK